VSAVERYLAELGAALHVRGGERRRFLRECGDHLADAAAERGEEAAVRAFGPPPEIAAAFDAEVASPARRVVHVHHRRGGAHDRWLDARADPRVLARR
jgi:hypothetical protein